MEAHRVRTFLSRHVFLPWVIHGPWTRRKLIYNRALVDARQGFAKWERSDPEQRAGWVLNELRSLVRWAGEKVPYYRETFRNLGFDPRIEFSFEDYRRLPPLEKQTLRERAVELIADGFTRATMSRNSTGGSTGEPIRFWLDQPSRAWRDVATQQTFARIGWRSGERVSLIWGFNADLKKAMSTRTRVAQWLAHRQVNDCYHSSLSDDVLDKFHARIARYQPEFLWCYSSALSLLAHRLRETGRKPAYPRRGIVTGAEKLDPAQRKIIESVFKVPIYESYGSRECGLIGMQLSPTECRLHVTGANILAEPYGEVDPAAANEILVTDLHRLAMPILRYRIGDRARFPSTGSEAPVEYLEEVTGRTVEQILLPDGRRVPGLQFAGLLRRFDIREYQVIQETSGNVCVMLVPGAKLASQELEKIDRILKTTLEGVSLSISLVSSIERTQAGKSRPVISRYRKADTFAERQL